MGNARLELACTIAVENGPRRFWSSGYRSGTSQPRSAWAVAACVRASSRVRISARLGACHPVARRWSSSARYPATYASTSSRFSRGIWGQPQISLATGHADPYSVRFIIIKGIGRRRTEPWFRTEVGDTAIVRRNRSEVVVEDEVGVYHCIQRAVRRAFLCEVDPLTNQSFEQLSITLRNSHSISSGPVRPAINKEWCVPSADCSPARAKPG